MIAWLEPFLCTTTTLRASLHKATKKHYLVLIERLARNAISLQSYTVNIEIFAQYICLRISSSILNVRKFDVSENCYHNRRNRIKWHVHENLTTRICLLVLDARKFGCTKISPFTVINSQKWMDHQKGKYISQ